MMNVIQIRWNRGQMTVNQNEFFPASISNINKLKKVIDMDWKSQKYIQNCMVEYLEERISSCELAKKNFSEKYFKYMQEKADLKQIVSSRKHPNGIPLTKEELARCRTDLKTATSMVKGQLSGANQNQRLMERLQKNLEQIKEWRY